MSDAPTLAAAAPAGGAATGQVVAMVIGLSVGFSALILTGEAHRRGRRTPLGTLAAFSARVSGLPVWAALPLAVTGIALVGALFGYMWDVSLHIDRGRDAGPFANPSHYFILAGLYGIVAGGYLSSVLVRSGEGPGRSAIRIAPNYEVPLGGALIAAAGAFALMGFPLDDLWHRLFGQDVTLWGPTHLIMLSGGLLTLVGCALLFEEGVAVSGPRRDRIHDAQLMVALRRVGIVGGLLIGLSTFQGEFDFGVPQFRMVFHPMLIALSAGLALTAGRIWIGKGGALATAVFFFAVRGLISLIVGDVFGETMPALPLYFAEALCVEAVALATGRDRPLALGVAGGLLCGTVGLAVEWLWVGAVFPLPWSRGIVPEALIV